MYDICSIGHITQDKVVTPRSVNYMPGGTAYYFSSALQNLDTNYLLVTSVGESEQRYVDDLRNKGINVIAYPSATSVYFENIYGDNPDNRTQNVLALADPFTVGQLARIEARTFHLGPLLAGDIPVSLIQFLASKGLVSLDVQGYLRKVENRKVYPTDWPEKQQALQYVDILKADETEMAVLTGRPDLHEGVKILADWGVKEAVITNGSMGSAIYSNGMLYHIPAYFPPEIADTTGCGDTYMAGYLYKRSKGADAEQAGHFAAGMAGLKTASSGPFTGTEEEILALIANTK
ncbi:MAG TPA: PfkB family carbohydrate kinase [Mucilaginibacter sp.]|nr:PfkB family carbohydrate kinase [Mucilaginibacter sp.]